MDGKNRRYIKLGKRQIPNICEDLYNISWDLRFSEKIDKADLKYAGDIIDYYRTLFLLTNKERNELVNKVKAKWKKGKDD
jgi:hypothetical protein